MRTFFLALGTALCLAGCGGDKAPATGDDAVGGVDSDDPSGGDEGSDSGSTGGDEGGDSGSTGGDEGSDSGQSGAEVEPEAQTAAEAGLSILTANLTTDTLGAFGLDSLDQAASLSLAEPMAVYALTLEALQGSDDSADPASLLIDARAWWFPVELDGSPVTGLVVVESEAEGWVMVEFGSSASLRATESLRRSLSAEEGQALSSISLVRVLPLHAALLTWEAGGALQMRSVHTQAHLGLSAGAGGAASDLLVDLRSYAKTASSPLIRPEED